MGRAGTCRNAQRITIQANALKNPQRRRNFVPYSLKKAKASTIASNLDGDNDPSRVLIASLTRSSTASIRTMSPSRITGWALSSMTCAATSWWEIMDECSTSTASLRLSSIGASLVQHADDGITLRFCIGRRGWWNPFGARAVSRQRGPREIARVFAEAPCIDLLAANRDDGITVTSVLVEGDDCNLTDQRQRAQCLGTDRIQSNRSQLRERYALATVHDREAARVALRRKRAQNWNVDGHQSCR